MSAPAPYPAGIHPDYPFRLQQQQFECAGWKRLLTFMMEENVYLKTLVPDILSHNDDKAFLAGIEQYNDRFVRQDALIGLLRSDVAAYEKLLLKEELEAGKYSDLVARKLEILRNNLHTVETQFSDLRNDFFHFLLEKA